MNFFVLLILLFLSLCGVSFSNDISSKVRNYVEKAVTIRQITQKKEDNWFKEKEKLRAEYENLKLENSYILKDIHELQKDIDIHRDSIAKIKKDISNMKNIQSQMDPFIKETFNKLSSFIKVDVPFLKKERADRIKNLKQVIYDPTVSIAEKFRKLIEALFIEAEYGNTIEVYQDRIRLRGENIYANIFRLGRVCLFFQSLDKKTCGYFDPSSGWKRLPKVYNRDITLAIDIAEKRRPIEIIELPIGRIKR